MVQMRVHTDERYEERRVILTELSFQFHGTA